MAANVHADCALQRRAQHALDPLALADDWLEGAPAHRVGERCNLFGLP